MKFPALASISIFLGLNQCFKDEISNEINYLKVFAGVICAEKLWVLSPKKEPPEQVRGLIELEDI